MGTLLLSWLMLDAAVDNVIHICCVRYQCKIRSTLMCKAESLYQFTGTNQQAGNSKVNRVEAEINNVCCVLQLNVGIRVQELHWRSLDLHYVEFF